MVEGVLIFLGVTSYVCVAKLVTDRTEYLCEEKRFVLLVLYILFGWIIFPVRLVYGFWDWLLTGILGVNKND